MGFLRKTLIIGTGGLAPVKANSNRERIAKATEKQLKLQQQMLNQQQASAPRYSVNCPHCHASLTAPVGNNIRCPKCRRTMNVTPPAQSPGTAGLSSMAAELEKLANLHSQGVLSASEFAVAKAKLLSGS